MVRCTSAAAFAGVLLAFVLPFGTVGCDDERVRVSGIDLATFSVDGTGRDGSGEPNLAQQVETGGGFLALVALLCAAIGLVLVATRRGWWGVISVVGLLALLALPWQALSELADVWLHVGFVLAVAGFSLAAGARALERGRRREAAGRSGWPYVIAAIPLGLTTVLIAVAWVAEQPPS